MFKKINLRIFLTCLAIAVFFWFLNSLGRQFTSILNYPVVIKYDQKNIKIPKNLPKTIKVKVTAQGWYLFKFKFKKSNPLIIRVHKYRRRHYISNYELSKFIMSQINDFKLDQVITKNIKIYE